MNEVTTIRPDAPAAARALAGDIGTAKALANLQRNLLDPLERDLWPADREELRRLRDELRGRTQRAAARAIVAMLPQKRDIDAYSDALASALATAADPSIARPVIGMMLDAFPAGRPANLRAYADAMLHDVTQMGFPPAVVAMACQTVRRTSKFLPAVAEVIEACQAARKDLEGRAAANDYLARIAAGADAIAALPEPVQPPL